MASAAPSIHSLAPETRADLMRREWDAKSRFQQQFGRDKVNLNAGDHPQALREQVLRILVEKGQIKKGSNILTLHEQLTDEQKEYGINDGVNKISTYLYDTDEAFTACYMRFVKECLSKHFPYPFYFQATPTVRIHCPKGKNSHHYPRYHTDIGYGHPPQEINFWIPLTPPQVKQKHGFRIMSVADSRKTLEPFGYDFEPFIEKAVNDPAYNQSLNAIAPEVDTPYGEFFAFDSRCIHTGEPLLHHSRASIDVRLIPVEDYGAMKVTYQGTGRRRIPYEPGQAYYALSSDKL